MTTIRKTLLFASLLLLPNLTWAQQSRTPEPQELHVIGELNTHTEGSQLFATVFDKRTDEVYKFILPDGNKCNQLVEGKVYEWKLLASCNSTECEGLNFTLVDFAISPLQAHRDVKELRKGTRVRFNYDH